MKGIILISIVIVAFALVLVSQLAFKNPPGQSVWLQKQLTQCAEEWQQWVNDYILASGRTPNIEAMKEGIVQFYAQKGITIHDLAYEQLAQDAVVCFGCPCASGNVLSILISPEGKEYFLAKGFSLLQQPATNRVLIGIPNLEGTPFVFQNARVEGDTFKVTVSFSGGCADHLFNLYAEGAFKESAPVELDLFLIHSGPEDPCDGIGTKELAFDLSPIKDLYFNHYQRYDPFTILVFANDRSSLIGRFDF